MTIETPRDIIELRESVEALQSRNAFQDDIIEQLNNELAIHQLELSELRSQLKLIARRVQDNAPGQSQSQEVEPPPPHY
ncbi:MULTISPECIES: SlyX family protein [unclassified Colwellia]|jgi:SlyX protein|uniref:SlyX family protein n=1 Tax=unclassified Colwellia TaxID=196834 RepID=UPI0015F642DA|nr:MULTISPECIES: SlyX family protein [unclassified Colwellia]MBA6232829.1 SlyX family protein [Colwellia sp. MB02u-7]MBA6236078.1 SlyX family protein [Colwellia sp. MB02u-11]MBA6256668.1 SlyX family protein [Colwellia sp. MB3u-28]MBA6261383.1 SlyX family protein [Colwellia sp. MB3u-41]MBA6263958.1 SlyX family protein [Colwellia sp. Bg11-12]